MLTLLTLLMMLMAFTPYKIRCCHVAAMLRHDFAPHTLMLLMHTPLPPRCWPLPLTITAISPPFFDDTLLLLLMLPIFRAHAADDSLRLMPPRAYARALRFMACFSLMLSLLMPLRHATPCQDALRAMRQRR